MLKPLLRQAAALSCASLAFNALAYDLPGMNLGQTSFYDGSPAPAGPGWYLEEYLAYSRATRFNDANGNKLPLPKQTLEIFAPTTQLIYVGQPLANGGNLGVTAILPALAHVDVDDGLNNAALSAREGFSDLTLGAFYQLPTIMAPEGGPRLTQRVELDVVLPTGAYDRDKSISPGSNFWSVEPYYAATVWATPQWSFSGRFMYRWNGKNDDPLTSFGNVSDTQAGQALHANLTTQYALTPQLSLGINGYWLKQITDTRIDGSEVSGRKEKVWAIGPGLVYAFSPKNVLTFNAYFEQDAENRTEGDKVVLNFLHKL